MASLEGWNSDDIKEEISSEDLFSGFLSDTETREIGTVEGRSTSELVEIDQTYHGQDDFEAVTEDGKTVPVFERPVDDDSAISEKEEFCADEEEIHDKSREKRETDMQKDSTKEFYLCNRPKFPFFVEAKVSKKEPSDVIYVNINKIYQFKGRIRNGRYTTINKYYSKILDKDVAIKIIPKVDIPSERLFKFVPRELDVAEDKEFGHPNIVKFLETYDTILRCYIIMEYVDDGNLTDYINQRGRLDPYSYKLFFGHLISAVYYCLQHGICHRKLSTENCLISKNMELKLCDFSYSSPLEDRDGVKSTHCGVLGFLAPEILMGRHYQPCLTESWSCGIILFAMIYGAMPFNSSNFPKLLKDVKKPIKYHWYHDTTIDPIMIMYKTISPVKKRWSIMKVHGHSWVSPRPTVGYEYYKNWFKKHNIAWGNKEEKSIEQELLELKKREQLHKCLNATI